MGGFFHAVLSPHTPLLERTALSRRDDLLPQETPSRPATSILLSPAVAPRSSSSIVTMLHQTGLSEEPLGGYNNNTTNNRRNQKQRKFKNVSSSIFYAYSELLTSRMVLMLLPITTLTSCWSRSPCLAWKETTLEPKSGQNSWNKLCWKVVYQLHSSTRSFGVVWQQCRRGRSWWIESCWNEQTLL